MSTEPALTEAERAAWRLLDELVTVNRSEVADLLGGLDLDACPPVGSVEAAARAVVAALTPLIAAKALWDAAEALDKRVGSASLQAIDGLNLACNELAEMSAALRTTTPEDQR